MSELKNLNYHFLHDADPVYRKNEEFLFALISSSSVLENKETFDQYISQYQKNFPNGKYKEIINKL